MVTHDIGDKGKVFARPRVGGVAVSNPQWFAEHPSVVNLDRAADGSCTITPAGPFGESVVTFKGTVPGKDGQPLTKVGYFRVRVGVVRESVVDLEAEVTK